MTKVFTNFKTKGPKRNTRAHRQDKKHLEFVASLPSCLSGEKPAGVAHHLLSGGGRGVGMKAPDRLTLPLTPDEHRRLHNECAAKTEEEWFLKFGVLPHILARTLWNLSGDYEAAEHAVMTHHKWDEG